MESIEDLWLRFSLTAKEEMEFDLEEYDKEPSFLLAAKFITHRVLNVEAVAWTFKPLWKAEKGFSVKDMGENTLLFTSRRKQICYRSSPLNHGPMTNMSSSFKELMTMKMWPQ